MLTPVGLDFRCSQPISSQLSAQLLPTLVCSITAAVQPHAAVTTSNDFCARRPEGSEEEGVSEAVTVVKSHQVILK